MKVDRTPELEADIMRDALKILKFYSDVPKKGATGEHEWWKRASDDFLKYATKYDNHPLAVEIGCALFQYFEKIGGYRNEIGEIINDTV